MSGQKSRLRDVIRTLRYEEEKDVMLRTLKEESFPFERPGLDPLMKQIEVVTRKGNKELDAEFERIDMEAALRMRKTQREIPFSVPRMGLIDVFRDKEAVITVEDGRVRQRTGYDEWKTVEAVDHSTQLSLNEEKFNAIKCWPQDVYKDIEEGVVSYRRKKEKTWGIVTLMAILASIGVIVLGFVLSAWCFMGLILTVLPGALGVYKSVEWGGGESVTLTATPPGVVPQRTREMILKNKHRFRHMFLLFDATWQADRKALPVPNPDPLVIGVQDDVAWIVDEFDLTAKEQYLKDKFGFTK